MPLFGRMGNIWQMWQLFRRVVSLRITPWTILVRTWARQPSSSSPGLGDPVHDSICERDAIDGLGEPAILDRLGLRLAPQLRHQLDRLDQIGDDEPCRRVAPLDT